MQNHLHSPADSQLSNRKTNIEAMDEDCPVDVDPSATSASAGGRNKSYTAQEDLMVAQAFIAASEDPLVANYQKGGTFQNKMCDAYLELCIEMSRKDHAFLTESCGAAVANRSNKTAKKAPSVTPSVYVPGMNLFATRNANSVHTRFKKFVSKDCMLMAGIVAQFPRHSGEDTHTMWARQKDIYAKRHGPFKYELAYNYLKDKPKWSIFCEENKDVEKSARPPKGVKAAKRAEAYSKHVNRALDNLVGPAISWATHPC